MTSLNQPDVANDLVWTYQDNADGTSTKAQTNRGAGAGSVTWTYDPAGRLVSRAYQDAAGTARTTTYTYTGAGSAWTATDTGGTISATNDRLGRPTQVTVSGDTAATTTFGYSFTSPVRTDASGAYTMTLDKAGRTTAIDDPLHTPNWQFTYGANGEPLTTTWPTTTALTTTSSYDALGRLTSRTTTPGPRAAYTQAYNRAGERLTEASTITGDPSNGTATTGYDPMGRLISYTAPGRTLGATWDAVPNRTTLTTEGTPVTTAFDAASRPTSGGRTYDPDGRMTGRPGQVLSYDSLGRLAEVRTSPGNALVARYTYDALDRLRTVERLSQATIRFRYAGTSTAVAQVVDDTSGTVLRNVTTGPEGTVLQDWDTTAHRLYGTNGHHDTTFTTDGAGTITSTARYDPWGTVLSSTGTLPDWRFQGSWLDTSTNLAWSVARWYDPVQGTFLSEDTLLGSPESPASRHLYAYAEGDPVGGWDPGGQTAIYFDHSKAQGRRLEGGLIYSGIDRPIDPNYVKVWAWQTGNLWWTVAGYEGSLRSTSVFRGTMCNSDVKVKVDVDYAVAGGTFFLGAGGSWQRVRYILRLQEGTGPLMTPTWRTLKSRQVWYRANHCAVGVGPVAACVPHVAGIDTDGRRSLEGNFDTVNTVKDRQYRAILAVQVEVNAYLASYVELNTTVQNLRRAEIRW